MYKSSEENSIWIPLAKVVWDWYGSVQFDDINDVWIVDPNSGHETTNPEFSETNDFPEWEEGNIATPTNPEWEEVEE